MSDDKQSLTGLVDKLDDQADQDADPTIRDLLEASGNRSMGPALFLPALIAFSPIGAVPGMSIAMGTVIILFAAQLMLGRAHLWVPGVIGDRRLPADKIDKAAAKMRGVAKRFDRWLGDRWTWATNETGAVVVGALAVLLGASMYPLALVPFGVFAPSGALMLLAAGLMTRDGVLVVAGGLCALVAGWFVVEGVAGLV